MMRRAISTLTPLRPRPQDSSSATQAGVDGSVSSSTPRPLAVLPRHLGRRPLWIGLLVAAVLLSGLGLWQRQRSTARRDLSPFTVLARSGTLPGVVSATGELDAGTRVNISPKRQGVLKALYVDEGMVVKAGQALAVMDGSDLQDRLQELEANLRSAEAELQRSRSELSFNEPLFRQGAISRSDINRFRADFEVKRAAVRAAAERLAQRRIEREELVVRAPFDGVISQRYADPGAFVTPTTTASSSLGATSSSIVEVARGLEVIAKVPESDIGRLRLGMPASVRVDSFPARRYAATVRQIAPRAVKTNNVTSFEVKLALRTPAPELRIGMTADIDFSTGQLQARTVVPTVAIVTEAGRPGVLVVGRDQQPEFRPVELGASSGRSTQILNGLNPETRVFIDLPPWAKKRRDKS